MPDSKPTALNVVLSPSGEKYVTIENFNQFFMGFQRQLNYIINDFYTWVDKIRGIKDYVFEPENIGDHSHTSATTGGDYPWADLIASDVAYLTALRAAIAVANLLDKTANEEISGTWKLTPLTASTLLALNASKEIASLTKQAHITNASTSHAITDPADIDGFIEHRVLVDNTGGSRTGSTSWVVVGNTWTCPANAFITSGLKIRARCSGRKTGTAGNASIGLSIGGNLAAEHQLNGTAEGTFIAEFELFATGSASQDYSGWVLLDDDSADVLAANTTTARDFTSSRDMGIMAKVYDAADTIYIDHIEIFFTKDSAILRDDLVTNSVPSVESALNSLGTKVNSILSALETAQVLLTS